MKPRHRWILSIVFLGILPVSLFACLWDYDTLKQERARFPSTLELITGKFLRHSPEFYRWRIEDRLKKLQADPNQLAYYDDLAVAYEKTGQHEKAIETMLAKEKIKPGLYETYSNLGTFYILAGDFKKGLPFIDKALAINPDAHFGREKYQKWLVEYALSKFPDGKIQFPMHYRMEKKTRRLNGMPFPYYLREKNGSPHLSAEELQKAIKAILGMMRFADYENPLLLEVLGDLLASELDRVDDAKRLASIAYLKASYVVKDGVAKDGYRQMAWQALTFQLADPASQKELLLEALEADFKKQLEEADLWYADLRAKEISWIEKGLDPEREFDALYTTEPAVETMGAHAGIDPADSTAFFSLGNLLTDRKKQVAGLVVAGVTGFILAMRFRNSRNRMQPSA